MGLAHRDAGGVMGLAHRDAGGATGLAHRDAGDATGLGPADLSEWIDRVASVYAAGTFADDAALARREYRDLTGRALDEDGDGAALERALREFLAWYVLERSLRGGDPPVLRYLREARASDEDAREALAVLALAHRSLFDVEAIDGERAVLGDLLLGGAWAVPRAHDALPGLCEGDLIEARLVALEGGMAFLGSCAFQPREAREAVLDLCDAAVDAGTARADVLWNLVRRRAKAERYKHLPVERFYR